MSRFFQKSDSNAEMSFMQHLEALRWHLFRSVIAIIAVALIAFLNKEFIFDTVIFGPKHSDFPTYRALCWLSEKLSIDMCIKDFPFIIMSMTMSGQFTMHMWVAFITGLVVGFPYLLWEVWRFVKPALTSKEKQYSTGIVFFSSLLFITGVLFGYFVIAPLSINFLGSYQVSEQVKNQISLDSYISTITFLTFASGIVFELPIVIYFLSKIGIVTPQFMRNYRKHAVVVILIIAAVITPSPDVTSQVLVAIPLYLLYEISIFVSVMVVRKQELKSS
ncbi:MAG TPA: twin-arginine translocase subunit TatC [Bacteroidia bacterium]|nr:twin-arginine translocase subunit TatC [Bacteroidia bacterium]